MFTRGVLRARSLQLRSLLGAAHPLLAERCQHLAGVGKVSAPGAAQGSRARSGRSRGRTGSRIASTVRRITERGALSSDRKTRRNGLHPVLKEGAAVGPAGWCRRRESKTRAPRADRRCCAASPHGYCRRSGRSRVFHPAPAHSPADRRAASSQAPRSARRQDREGRGLCERPSAASRARLLTSDGSPGCP